MNVDLNCDMGESFGAYRMGQDEAIMDFVSSVNIACGFHAGDPSVMRHTVANAVKKSVAIGAHPGYPDLQGFGRRDIQMSYEEVYNMIVYQIGALTGFVRAAGTSLRHIKPHGALYNAAAKNAELAGAIARAVKDVDKNLILVGLAGSQLIEEGKKYGLSTLSEVFADRTYQDDGSLTSRSLPNALIENPNLAAAQVLNMITDGAVRTVSGNYIKVNAQTVCIHGDGRLALEFARTIHDYLKKNNVGIQHPER